MIFLTRYLLENMLEVHLSSIPALHHHSADDRSIRVHHEEGEIRWFYANANSKLWLEYATQTGLVIHYLLPYLSTSSIALLKVCSCGICWNQDLFAWIWAILNPHQIYKIYLAVCDVYVYLSGAHKLSAWIQIWKYFAQYDGSVYTFPAWAQLCKYK